jgi:hypothetical protein
MSGSNPSSTSSTFNKNLKKQSRAVLLNRISVKFQAALWVIAAILLEVYGRVFAMMWEPGKNNPTFILIGWIATSVFVMLMLYALIWLPYIERVGLPFDEYSPQLSYVGAAAGITAFLSFLIGLWPAFGWATPLVIACETMGVLMVGHFIFIPVDVINLFCNRR